MTDLAQSKIAAMEAILSKALRTLNLDTNAETEVSYDSSLEFIGEDGQHFEKLPPRILINATLHPVPGSSIRLSIWLPDAEFWNGRFLGLGNGGSAGRILVGHLAGRCAQGYAVANTDMGTGQGADSGVGNPEVWKDFGFRATHVMTVGAKQLVTEWYGRAPEYSYFSGGSTGGQQALQEAQRYPEDYDGIVAMVPAHCRTPLHAYFLWNAQVLRECSFTEEQEAGVIAAANTVMADRGPPVAAGKFVYDPRCSDEDIEAVIALAMKQDSTLTPAHAEALRKLFGGPRHTETEERIFGGIPLGSSIGKAHGDHVLYLFRWAFGADKPLEAINFGVDIDAYTATLGPYLNADNPDLSAFKARGGKLIMASGTADSVVPYHATLNYYERVTEEMGGLEATQSFCRFYMIPGKDHGSGGPGVNRLPDMLTHVRAWCEDGIAPETINAQRWEDDRLMFELPLYPYPTQTAWDADTASYQSVEGPRGGVERVSDRFLPAATETSE